MNNGIQIQAIYPGGAKTIIKDYSQVCSLLYVLKGNRYIKIGISKNPQSRLRNIQTGCPHALKLIHCEIAWNMDVEWRYHSQFKHLKTRKNGEWFKDVKNEISNYFKTRQKERDEADDFLSMVEATYNKKYADLKENDLRKL